MAERVLQMLIQTHTPNMTAPAVTARQHSIILPTAPRSDIEFAVCKLLWQQKKGADKVV
jgi:hypothetical protein